MEKAILKTLIYASLFDYPLKAYEIHKWLIGKQSTLYQVEKGLERLIKKRKVGLFKGFYFLKKQQNLVLKRKRKEKESKRFLFKAKVFVWFLQIIPAVKLAGISGGLALNNAEGSDDIDLFLITAKNRLWICRLVAIFILDLLGVRRKPKMKNSQVKGKLCLNIFLEEDRLKQQHQDIFVAHELLQMRVLWQRDGVYSKYLMDNEWAFKFLPNWVGQDASLRGAQRLSNLPPQLGRLPRSLWSLAMTRTEKLVKWFQLKIMKKPEGMERIEEGALYFHPQDIRPKILKLYRQKLASYLAIDIGSAMCS